MRLSEIKGEESLDVLAELLDPITEIMSDAEVMRIYQTKQPRVKLVKFIIKKHKKSVIQLLATLERESVEEYIEHMTLVSLPVKLIQIINDIQADDDLKVLFTSQGQTMEENSFGSATESTEEEEQ